MGLDQFAYVSGRRDPSNSDDPNTREIAYWRKHPNLQGWMERLWISKDRPGVAVEMQDVIFNGVELELTWQDIEDLERAVTHSQLPATTGMFFGNNADEHYREHDLEFCKNARAELFMGLKVFYNSSW